MNYFQARGISTLWYEEGVSFDAFYYSGPPFPSVIFLLNLIIRGKTLIFEYRDGWSINHRRGYGGCGEPNYWAYLYSLFVEKIISAISVKVIVVTPGLERYYRSRKTVLILNGSDFERPRKRRALKGSEGTLRVVCFGQFASYGIKNAIECLTVLRDRYSRSLINLHIYSNGAGEPEFIPFDLKNVTITYFDPVPDECKESILNSYDLGLSIIRDPDIDFGTKSFDYAQMGLPILNYFHRENDFTHFFSGYFDTDFNKNIYKDFSRTAFLERSEMPSVIDLVKFRSVS